MPKDVDGDGNRLWQVVDALVANAIEHTDRGEDESATARAEPDGSGLRTASELVRRMGGELDVRGRLGEGSRFGFTFELGDVAQSGPSRAGPRTLRGVRALVVDDNETNRTILAHQLGNWGMHVESADGGEAALAALRAADAVGHWPDLLVLDLHMPGMDGLELARRIAADPALRGAPALMLTSSEVDLEAAELDASGIERNLTKPARHSVLHDTLASMLRAAPVRDGADASADAARARGRHGRRARGRRARPGRMYGRRGLRLQRRGIRRRLPSRAPAADGYRSSVGSAPSSRPARSTPS